MLNTLVLDLKTELNQTQKEFYYQGIHESRCYHISKKIIYWPEKSGDRWIRVYCLFGIFLNKHTYLAPRTGSWRGFLNTETKNMLVRACF